MSKKVLVLTGSARKGGNSDLMSDALIRGIKENGNEAVKFETAFKDIKWCSACDRCWENGQACIDDDDFHELEPLLESCDTAVFVAPVYWMGFPAALKAAIDKFYAYGGSGGLRPLAIKESALMLCGGDPEASEYDYVTDGYERIVSYLGWKDRGTLWQGGTGEPGTIGEDALEKAEEIGRTL